ncbi:hypothetical protein SDC9_102132 [bioreactor metagenome]|uniref:Uncharacterized protein n=1 Tax=bioreactor metagenome TaxID=1076179 RepID=A0A645ARE1_9ZZZZ
MLFDADQHEASGHEHRKADGEDIDEPVFMVLGKQLALLGHVGIEIIGADFLVVDFDGDGADGPEHIRADGLDPDDVEFGVLLEVDCKIVKSQVIVDNRGVVEVVDTGGGVGIAVAFAAGAAKQQTDCGQDHSQQPCRFAVKLHMHLSAQSHLSDFRRFRNGPVNINWFG